METLLTLLQKSTDFLATKGIENPRANAEFLFAHGLSCKRLDLYLRFDHPVSTEEQDILRPLIVRRSKHEPLQYIIGDTEFYGLTLSCDSRALIPRPETEELVELITQTFPLEQPPQQILDLGTGTGCLALALARAYPQAHVTAVDASPDALALARSNAEINQLPLHNLAFVQSDWFAQVPDRQYNLIVSNPPYLTQTEWESATPDVRQFEPKQALIGGGDDGGDDLRHIIRQSFNFLAPGGLLALETGIAQHPSLQETSARSGYLDISSHKDLQHRPRFFFARRPA